MPLYENIRRYIAVILIVSPFVFYAQESNQIIELKVKLKEENTSALDSAFTKVNLAYTYIYHDLDSATVYVDNVLDGVRLNEFVLPDTFYKHLLIKAWTHQGKGELFAAKTYMNKAIEKAKYAKKRDTHVELIMNYGSLLVQTRDTSTLDFVERELPKVDTTLGKADYVLYTLLHQYESKIYAQQEDYERAIKTLLKISSAKFLKNIPNYKYGIRTSLSEYIAYMGDYITAAKQLELALGDTLHIHQRKEIYYQLANLKIEVDSLSEGENYLSLYKKLTPQTNFNNRDIHYLAAKLQYSKGSFDKANVHIDSSLYFQQFIEDNQKLLDGMLVKASLCEKKKDPVSLGEYTLKIDTLLRTHQYLNTTKNLVEVCRIKLLHKLLNPSESAITEFDDYEKMNSMLVYKKINPQLVAAVLAFDNQEQQYQIDELLLTKEKQTVNIRTQANQLNMSIAGVCFFMVLSGIYWWISNIRKQKAETLELAKKEAIENSLKEKALLHEKAVQEKKRIAQEAERERKELIAQQKALESRVDKVESKKQELESRLKMTNATQKENSIIFATKTKTYKIKIDQFIYAVAENDGTRIYLKDKNFWLILSLKEVLQQLSTEQFVRIFRSTVVNVDYINAVNSKYIVLENGEELALSRTYREEVRERVG